MLDMPPLDSPIMEPCPACGTPNPAGVRFCHECGHPFAADAPESGGSRRVVTVLFCDLVGSTTLAERLDAEAVRRLMGG